MGVVIALTTTHLSEFETIFSGQLYADDHPLVKAHPDCFDADLSKYAHQNPAKVNVVEEATANPGEARRGPGRPRKDAE